ncbi:uncharacterized protein TRIADDRAFT_50686 [Trichoplax adhaerens]|uniref:Maternal embryonic leucine zipper kinase n=1 Tax=Trichoplax adhaerens TaxID=10228 RepID=B3S5D2_TRIAD|nr:hypothetical protein TRIADDRAFT_50686 [Trichoplax adhaerens]EDV22115.1 hypothetical protein TRIADDRAFT_50686 [Trichoplax adhaerens]|eukprot:XP_002115270.1 hypothetical protein TRIADDRAFT_50686 [Trichoplax adhaerens]
MPREVCDYYQVRETIGSGGFAQVKIAKHRLSGETVAIKVMNKVALGEDLPRVQREINALRSLRHQHISQMYQVIDTPDDIYIVMEYVPGGEVFDYIVTKDRLLEDEARKFFRQVISAIAYVHNEGFAHRDLKPENLLLDRYQNIKLIDFGLVAKPQSLQDNLYTCCGSPAYAAPELIAGKPYLGSKADIWSMGILLYALLCGYLPFDDDNTVKLYKQILKGEYETPRWLSHGSIKILDSMLQTDPNQRITVKHLLSHPWVMTNYGVPVEWRSKYKPGSIDSEVIDVMSQYYGIGTTEMSNEIAEWKFDHVCATYYILCNMKYQGKRPRLLQPFVRGVLKEKNTANKENIPTRANKENIQTRPAPRTPKRIADAWDELVINQTPERPRAWTEDNCNSPSTLCGNAYFLHADKSVAPLTPLSESKRWQSCDADLYKSTQEKYRTPSKTPKRHIFAAFGDNVGDIATRFKQAFTPHKTPQMTKPRKVKELYNVSATSGENADYVVDELKNRLVERGISYKAKTDYVLRCKILDSRLKALLSFELEVCELPSLNIYGIRHKRLKGDSWAYKKVCEDILTAAKL